MASFEIAVEKTLAHEGGYVNHPDDPGGETNYGISRRSYPNADIRNLTKEAAVKIYQRDFWLPLYSDIRYQRIANKIFDMSVNLGVTNSHVIVQKAMRNLGKAIKVDGVFGPNTLALVNQSDPNALLLEMIRLHVEYYLTRVERKPSQVAFLRGWIRRAFL